jgi:S-adenosylmethionine uptake transporter
MKYSLYIKAVFWILLVSFFSVGNDILSRTLGDRLPAVEIVFFRFFYALITLLPIMFYKGKESFKTSKIYLHVIRSLMGFGAVCLWCYGLTITQLALVTTLALTVPIFVLPMAYIILGEKVSKIRIFATLMGFVGILVILFPNWPANLDVYSIYLFGPGVLVISAILFAGSDIINKVMVKYENILAMLFYFALGTTLCSVLPLMYVWIEPTLYEHLFLMLLGMGGNSILYCLLKAFSYADVSALAPYRYFEMILSIIFGYVLFSEHPTIYTIAGASIIIPVTLFLALKDKRH